MRVIKFLLFGISIWGLLFFLNLFFFGLLVVNQRNSGPDLMVIWGRNRLMKESRDFEVNSFSSAYTTYEFDSSDGFESIDMSFCFYKVVGSRNSDMKNEKVALLEINKFYSVYLVLIVLFISILIFTKNLRWVLSQIKK